MEDFIDEIKAVMQKHYGSDLNYIIGEHIWWSTEDGYHQITIVIPESKDGR
tara:strand:- start:339 stop:491 length:153 start_codon:yes stop_codon:yes gene_type:complete